MIDCKVLICRFVCSLLQYIFKEYDIQVHKELCYGELNVITRVRLNIAKHIYSIVVIFACASLIVC